MLNTYITNPITGCAIIIGGDTFNRIVMESHDYIDGRLVRRQTAPPPQEQPVVEDHYLVHSEEKELIEAIINETRYNEENLDGRRLTFNDIQELRASIQADQDEYDDFVLQQDTTSNGAPSGPSGPPRTLADHAPRLAELNIELCKECLMPVNPSDLTDELCKDCASC
ncbi:unnamed protein product [Rhizophagus irregularis]|nr:unnamed protein product [Rhizophagus irregularis]